MSSENLEVVHEGWLTKSPPAKRVLKAVSVKLKWRRRWFVLRHSGELPGQYFLAYYTDKSRRKMKGRIDLDQCEQVDAGLRFEDRKSKYHYMFDIKTPKRTYYLAAESEEDMNRWVDFVCHVCGLKPFTVDENADFDCPSVNNLTRPFPISVEEHDEDHSSPDSPTSTSSSHYIPISECISGKPLLPILPRPTIEESYDSPRRIQPTPRLSESPPPSPGSESVFTDDDSSVNGSTLGRPSVNWGTFPILSQNSPDLPVAANRRFTKILPDGSLTAPPRPPKPSHLLETPTPPVKTEKIVESSTIDETYDFPRSHQMTPIQTQSRTNRYINTAPGQVPGNIFVYEFEEDGMPKVEEGKSAELESPNSINSPSVIVYASSASLEQTPPAVNRQLKPGRKFSDTSAELSPLAPLANPPIVNRRLKPTTQIKKNQDSFSDTTSTLRLCPPPTGSLSRQKSRMGPNTVPSVPTSFEPQSRIHRRHSASDDHIASDKVSSYQINKISSNSRYLAEASCFNDIQYLDLQFESCEKQYSENNRTTAKTMNKKKPSNVGGPFATLLGRRDYSMIDGAYQYKTVDFLKTNALFMTRKHTEQERQLGRQNMVN